MSRFSIKILLPVLSLIALSCKGGNLASKMIETPDSSLNAAQACPQAGKDARFLIVDWESADRGTLEAAMKKGLVGVRVDACGVEVVRTCSFEGAYGYTPLTPKHDALTMTQKDELYAHVPVQAVTLEARLEKAGALTASMMIVGMWEADRFEVGTPGGACADATHLLTSVAVGAYRFYEGQSASLGAEATVIGGAGAGAGTAAGAQAISQDGDEAKCEAATGSDTEPPFGCGALLRVELVPVGN